MKTLLRFFFRQLYHPFAIAYDAVAAAVSLGRWKDWVLSVIPYLRGGRILELGHGPGHLQHALLKEGYLAVGIDESLQMGRLARSNLRPFIDNQPQIAYAQINLARGLTQHLPFPDACFDSLVATFPSEYIFDPQTLAEAHRVLTENGRLIVLPGATLLGRGLVDRALALLLRITGQSPPDFARALHEQAANPFRTAGFAVEIHRVEVRSSLVLILVATREPQGS